ncbi:MAG: response regulator, partial [Myxococcales bacterium]|nr:response regulator [Myxococcales bacterium]
PQTCELRLQRSDGSPFWARLDAMSVAGQVQGQAAATRITVTDISEHKRLHEQLLQAQKMQAVGTLAGGVAHDINNMLAVVLGLGSLLEHEMGSEDPRISHVRGIVFAAEQGKHLVQSLLGFAREGQYERTACSLGEIAASVIDMLKRTISKQVVVEAHLDPQLDEVEGDPTQLTQTLLNLCLNASDALDGAGTVTISTSNTMLTDGEVPELAAGRYVKLQVRDTGRGMSEPTRLRAFDPFFTTKGTGEGTGLGLSMAYGVIKNHRGALALESDLGAGTTASLWLPALESRAAVLPKAAKAQTKRVDEKPTLLIVDDEKMVATVVKLMVESLGCKVIVANSGARALEIYRDDPESIDLVILDLSMPGMDGAECFEKLKELDSHVRVFISTGHGSSEKIERMLAQGALGVMRKPFSLHELSQMLAETLGEAVRAR